MILTNHVGPGTYDAKKLAKGSKKAHGSLQFKTIEGESLAFSMDGMRRIKIPDAKGGSAMILTADVHPSDGVVHVSHPVLMSYAEANGPGRHTNLCRATEGAASPEGCLLC